MKTPANIMLDAVLEPIAENHFLLELITKHRILFGHNT